MKSEVRFPAAFLDRADRVAARLNAERNDRPLTAHDVIRACAARALGLPSPIDVDALDVAIREASEP